MTTAARRTREQKLKRQRQHDRRVAEARAIADAERHERETHEAWMRFLVVRGVIRGAS